METELHKKMQIRKWPRKKNEKNIRGWGKCGTVAGGGREGRKKFAKEHCWKYSVHQVGIALGSIGNPPPHPQTASYLYNRHKSSQTKPLLPNTAATTPQTDSSL
jgi:hypothetical protein